MLPTFITKRMQRVTYTSSLHPFHCNCFANIVVVGNVSIFYSERWAGVFLERFLFIVTVFGSICFYYEKG